MTGQVTLDAIFPYARDIFSYPDLTEQGLDPHKVKEVLLWGTEDVNYRSDITETFDAKLSALQCHKSQVGHIPLQELEKRLRERHSSLAQGKEYELAEGFHRVEILW
jgi:LmbE family N-acetylglucosaminyl deacetylase